MIPPTSHGSTDSDELLRVVSHGRGGAGNIGEGAAEQEDHNGLPRLTNSIYTTGRGGTGNMALNDPQHPEYARAAQDVEFPIPPPIHTDFHGGRGGAGNVYHPEDEEAKAAKLREEEEAKQKAKPPPVDHSKIDYRGWADKGKDLLFRRSKNNH